MEWLARYLFSLVGTRYVFGGKKALGGLDCSGLVCEALCATGVLPHGTVLNAQALFNRFEHQGANDFRIGALVFYGSSVLRITHVGILLDSRLMIEAGGGNEETDTLQEAIERNAFVRMRPYRYRSDFLEIRRPVYPGYGP